MPTPAGQPNLFHERDLPENQWSTEGMLLGEWIVYPNVSINGFYKGGRVVATEDLPTSHAQQKALSTGILNSIRFGRNEGGLQQFHRWTNTLLGTPDGELNQLFHDGING